MLAQRAAPPSSARGPPKAFVRPLPRSIPNRTISIARHVAARSASEDVLAADVVIVGAGIVGLFAAQELLRNHLSVLLLERQGLCAGATGAGQGYLWMAHRTPGSVGWALAARSVALWRRQVAADEALRAAIEWQDCGSLLVSTSEAESADLSERQLALNAVGLKASYLDVRRLAELEPGLVPPRGGAGLLVQSDLQINGRAAAHTLLQRCRQMEGFRDLMGREGEVVGLELAAGPGGGHVVRTPHGRIHARHALVLSAGVWTGGLLSSATADAGWGPLLQPRRGHLLELPKPASMPRVAHGMMEMSYTKHYATASLASHAQAAAPATSPSPASASASDPSSSSSSQVRPAAEPVDITFTATTSASGTLLIGSSRESGVWDTTPSAAITAAILSRAAQFLPGLKHAAAAAAAAAASSGDAPAAEAPLAGAGGALAGLSIRVGLRPYAVGGLPLVGPVPGAAGLFVAAGHEGSGLCMGPATGELLGRHVRKHVGSGGGGGGGGGGGDGSLDTRSFEELLPEVRRRAASASAVPKRGSS